MRVASFSRYGVSNFINVIKINIIKLRSFWVYISGNPRSSTIFFTPLKSSFLRIWFSLTVAEIIRSAP